MITRHILALAVAAVAVGLALADAVAQSYPSRPIRLIVPFPAGGPPDTLAASWARHVVASGTDGCDRQSSGCRRYHRHARGRPCRARRLHAPVRQHDLALDRPGAVQEPRLDVKSFAPVASVSLGSMVLVVKCRRTCEDRGRARRLREGQSGQAA